MRIASLSYPLVTDTRRLVLGLLLALAAVVAFSARVRADDGPRFFLNPDGSVESRVAAVESKTAALERRISALERQLAVKATPAVKVETIAETGPGSLGTTPATFPLKATAPATQRVQICENGRCRIVEVPVQAAGNNCGSYLCPANGGAGGCDCTGCECVGVSPVAAAACGSCAGGTGRSGWYPGKLLGRVFRGQ